MTATPKRLREYGFATGQLLPGPGNLISDVSGVTVGHYTAPGPNRTGITIISPSEANIFRSKLPGAISIGNGFGKLTGSTQVTELGQIETPIALTSTHAVGSALQGLVSLVASQTPDILPYESINGLVGETNDWILNDLHTPTLKPSDIRKAWDARTTQFELGAVGAGAGTRGFSWKGGIGSASRHYRFSGRHYTLGTLVQTNYGGDLTILGVPVGSLLGVGASYSYGPDPKPDGSCMIVVATDAPLSSRQLSRLASRALLGLVRTGSIMATTSGDYAIAFSTASPSSISALPVDDDLNEAFLAAVEATEESLYDALFTAVTTTGRDGNSLQALPVEKVIALLRRRLS